MLARLGQRLPNLSSEAGTEVMREARLASDAADADKEDSLLLIDGRLWSLNQA